MIRLEIGGLNGDLREGGKDARIFVARIESSPRQQLRSPAFDTHGHAEAIKFDLMEPLRSGWSDLDRLAKLVWNPARKRRGRVLPHAGRAGLGGLCGRTLHNTRHERELQMSNADAISPLVDPDQCAHAANRRYCQCQTGGRATPKTQRTRVDLPI